MSDEAPAKTRRTPRKSKRPAVRSREFVLACKSAATVEYISEKTGMDKDQVRTRLRSLRKLGVEIPPMEGENTKTSVAELNELLKA